MTRIRPFRALRYDPARVSLGKVIVPPYDVIAAGDREGFYARDPHNAIRLELTRRVEDEAGADYAEVRRPSGLDALGRAGADTVRSLCAAPSPTPDGKTPVRDGFFGLSPEYYSRRIGVHERTSGPQATGQDAARRAGELSASSCSTARGGCSAAAPALEAEPLATARDEAGGTHRLARSRIPR